MKKLLSFLDNNILQIGVSFLLLFIPLYPKLPSVHITNTWVYIRLEDFFIAGLVFLWALQLIRKKISFPWRLGFPILLYWGFGLLSLFYSVIVLSPQLANFFPHVAALSYFRRIEYMVLFLIAASTIRNIRDVKNYIVVLSVALGGIVIYGLGQKYYLILWNMFPDFFKNYPFCFPSFQTGNEEFAKGLPLCLPPTARFTSTFGGHYDLAAYLVLIIPLFAALMFGIKKKALKAVAFVIAFLALVLLVLTASRISFIAYLLGISCMFIFHRQKKFILPALAISIALLVIFSGSTAKRFLETIRITSIVTNSQGEIVGEEVSGLPSELQKKIAKNPVVVESAPPTESLPQGSSFIALPQTMSAKTNSAMVKNTISPDEARRLKLKFGGVEISTISGQFLIQKALVYDISYTTRFQGEWPNAWRAFQRNIFFGSGFSSITLASDNDYIRALGETGILGTFSFIFIFIILGITLRNTLPSVLDPLAKSYLLGISGGFIGLALNATFIDVFEASKVAEPFWLLLGIGGGIILYYQKGSFKYLPSLKRFFTSTPLILLYFLLIIGIALMASINNFFAADDFTWLRWAAKGNLTKYFTDAAGFFYRPIPKSTVYFLYTFFSFQQQGYHIFILLMHFMMTVGVYLLGRHVFKSKYLAFLAAVLFALLPQHGEIVFWFSTLSTTLTSLFLLYGLLAFIKWRKTLSIISLAWVFILYVLGMLSYEMGIVFPLLCLITDIFLLRTPRSKKTYAIYLPFLILIPCYLWLRFAAHAVGFGGDYSYNPIKLIPNVIGNYIGYMGSFVFGQQFVPTYLTLRNNLKNFFIPLTALFIILVAGGIYYGLRSKQRVFDYLRQPNVSVVLYSLCFTFVPLITFLGLGNITERYGYLSSVGYVFLVIILLKGVLQMFFKLEKKMHIALFIAVLFISSVYSYQLDMQKKDWEKAGKITQNALSLFRVDYEFIPRFSNIYIVNQPIRRQQAWIFPTGLSDGLWFIYRDPTLKIISVKSVDEAKAMKKQSEETTLVKNFIFKFDKEGELYEVKQ